MGRVDIGPDEFLDTDNDQLPDWWEMQYFGSVRSGQTLDASYMNDGIPNGYEYPFNIDPTRPVSPDRLPRVVNFNGRSSLVYHQYKGGTGIIGVDYTANGVTYVVQVNDSLSSSNWRSGTNWVEWTGERSDSGDSTDVVSVRAKPPLASSPQLFFRLKVDF